MGIPALQMWEAIWRSNARVVFHEDNEAMIRVCTTGRNPTMRHLGRVHKVDVAWLHERFTDDTYDLVYTKTDVMQADLFTEGYTRVDKWEHAVSLITVVRYATWSNHPVPVTGGPVGDDT